MCFIVSVIYSMCILTDKFIQAEKKQTNKIKSLNFPEWNAHRKTNVHRQLWDISSFFFSLICYISCRGGGGVCINCQHNTQGRFCDECKDGYFRDPSTPMDSPDACRLCACFSDGTVGGNSACEPVSGQSLLVYFGRLALWLELVSWEE